MYYLLFCENIHCIKILDLPTDISERNAVCVTNVDIN